MLGLRKFAESQSSRFWDIAVAVIVGPLGLIFCGLAGYVVFRHVANDWIDPKAWLVAFFLGSFGWLATVTAYRLLTGRGRKRDGGLFAPWLLRLLGVVFLILGSMSSFSKRETYTIWELLANLAGLALIVFGCFYWASRLKRLTNVSRLQGNDT